MDIAGAEVGFLTDFNELAELERMLGDVNRVTLLTRTSVSVCVYRSDTGREFAINGTEVDALVDEVSEGELVVVEKQPFETEPVKSMG